MKQFFNNHKKMAIIVGVILVVIIIAAVIWCRQKPSNERNWSKDQQVLAFAKLQGNSVAISNIRNFSYQTEADYTAAYYDKTYDLNKLKKAYYVVEPFTSFQGPAHTFLTFEFQDNQFLSVSIEIRKQQGQVFSGWKSAFPYYELMYVVADEKDVIKLRSNFRKDKVFVYPIKSDRAALRNLFIDYMDRVNQLHDKPEFYNLFTNNCTTNIVDSINRATGTHIGWSYKVLLPSFSDEYAMSLDLLDTDLPLTEAREKFLINQRAEQAAADPDFSLKIRKTD